MFDHSATISIMHIYMSFKCLTSSFHYRLIKCFHDVKLVRSDLLIHTKNYFHFQYITKRYHLPTGKYLMKFHLPDLKKH